MSFAVRCASGAAGLTTAALILAVPSVYAAEQTEAPVASFADAGTRAIAAQDREAVQAAATLCGDGYTLIYAERLPDERRWGTLFTYMNWSDYSAGRGCAVFDNNLGVSKYMKLSICESTIESPECVTDAGNFSQYAGPVYSKTYWKYQQCSKVTAIMKNSASDSDAAALINRRLSVGTCN
ncbi:hypothetical protein [Streptomyces rubradiris]|uniref:Peptidase inhibitor family I36 n=1 Tax=Streptomyces rubradiris TaxID=285531 RepID=A0ABQ3RDE3_STRRR|nr:hypothetical protein [Streptomyces rubradiris]GHG95082.1 hypothetical protein GCM10018792_05600 [Streptomyces rubradiris]GHI53822.1 hypothetical protein Srubr_36680 [Streptomyces rubradiris]